VPIRIVDRLEAVQVDEKQCQSRFVSPCVRERVVEAIEEQGAVRHAGERVVVGHMWI
jgi:hypothetical protein